MCTYNQQSRTNLLRKLWLGVLLFAFVASPARAWWNDEWSSRKKITLDTSATGVAIAEQPGAVPVLLRLVGGNFNFAGAKEDGTDLRFLAEDDKTLLPFHIEKFDTLMNEAFVWVNVPNLKPGAKTTIWLYYGNLGGKVTKVEDAKGTYDADTVLVYHFNAQGQPAYDFSSSGNNAQNSGLNADGSMIGSGLKIDGKTTVTIPASSTLFWSEGASMTWSAWVKFGAPQPNAVFFSRRDANKLFLIGADSGAPFIEVTYQGASVRSAVGAPVAPNSWHHLAIVAAGETIKLFLDGELYSSAKAALPALNGPVVLGGNGVGGLMNLGGTRFSGEIDELEISKAARSPDFLKLAVASQGGGDAATKLLTMTDEVKPASWLASLKTGYIGVIVGSLSFDGWVVIGILMVMSVISWLVMVAKAGYLGRIGKGNTLFLAEWRQVATDLSVLEDNDGSKVKSMGLAPGSSNHRMMHQAPLYHIYHIGVEELRHRMDKDREGGSRKALSSRSIQAIRASLDGVRETQRLNDKMVLLTIAISGGPFLGLLGTVVGVMITFAAVAQAGDVNVNAIAPGIAAALLATVAGLAVAIPALFGYNYLLTRIKNATSDMHIFIDEFVTKLAEFYRE